MLQSANQQVSREAVKTLAIAVGVREAARQTGINENTVISWSKRDQWFVNPPKPPTVQAQNKVAISAIKAPSQALQELLASDSTQTKLGFSKAAKTVAEGLGEADYPSLIDKDTALSAKSWSGVAATVHSWEAKQEKQQGMVNITLVRMELAPNEELKQVRGNETLTLQGE